MKSLQTRSLARMAAAIVILVIASLLAMWKVNYVPRKEMNMALLQADSLLSLKLELEKQLQQQHKKIENLEKINDDLMNKLRLKKPVMISKENEKKGHKDLYVQLEEMKKMIITYQSQMRSLIIANEKLEKQVQSLALELK